MTWIKKTINLLIALAYGIFVMPLLFLFMCMMPIMAISDGFKIINTGYSVTGDYFSFVAIIAMMVYISLRIKAIRKIYLLFPFLYETVKLLAIACIFIGLGTEFINWSYTKVSSTRHLIGVVIFLASLVLWRVFISIHYTKKPIVPFIEKYKDKLTHYNRKKGDINV